jgi:hypothetical protein
MKKTFLFLLMVIFSSHLFSQNRLTFSNNIIKNVKGKIINQNDVEIKVEVNSDFNQIKMACDTLKEKVSFDWKLNYDKNWEKQFVVGGKNVLITFYPTDKYLYFEFTK